MASHGILDPLFTYEGRLATFHSAQPVPKRRTSSANSRASKSAKWPHPSISPEDLAKAGLYYYPSSTSPDNVACFLCKKSLDGWEEYDDPLVEHLKHAPECGWAIVASIGAQDSELCQEYPLSATMIEARKETFADKWPHEDKKGWQCKVKQLVGAGWKYTPTAEYDDMATCTYCELALDNWEPKDKPLEEHHKRSPDCAFFKLINEHDQPLPAKKTKAKKGRPSKASRLSTQSNLSILSEAPSFMDLPTQEDDSILTTATNATMTSQVGKKTGKAKKTTAAKGRKAKAKKDEPVEVEAVPEPEYDVIEVKTDLLPKVTRGRKRKSEEMNTTMDEIHAQAPEPKKRTIRKRASVAMEVEQPDIKPSVIEPESPAENKDDAPAKNAPAKKRGRLSGTKTTRKASRSSAATKAAVQESLPADEEIDQALEEDLAKPLSDDEEIKEETEIAVPKTRRVSRAKPASVAKRATRSSMVSNSADHAMFDVHAMEVDDAAIDSELQAMEEESAKLLPRAKGAKGKQTRKPSAKQLALVAKKAAYEAGVQARAAEEAEAPVASENLQDNGMDVDEQDKLEPMPSKGRKASSCNPAARKTRASVLSVDDGSASLLSVQSSTFDFGNDTNASIASQDTVVKGRTAKKNEPIKKALGGRKAKKAEPAVKEPYGGDESANLLVASTVAAPGSVDEPIVEEEVQKEADPSIEEEKVEVEAPTRLKATTTTKTTKAKATKTKGKGKAVQESSLDEEAPRVETAILPPASQVKANTSTKRGATVTGLQSPEPVKETKESTPSSPQSSDAENHPPSSKPSTTKQAQPTPQQVPIDVSTPTTSPSKRNAATGISTSQPWISVNIETILLRSPSSDENDKQERTVLGEIGWGLNRISKGDQTLTSPEKKMTVEEWIKHNANLAEERLREECERIVGVFEGEGGRAMRALEGIECVE